MTTNIEWVRNPDGSKGETWPVVTGCSPVSTGCRNCYAARMAATRLKHHPRYKGLAAMPAPGMFGWTGEVRLNLDVLEQPLRWKKPRMIFVASMGDLFHEDVPFTMINSVLNRAYRCPQHTFLVLTKRPERMLEWFRWFYSGDIDDAPPFGNNLWLGVSVENQATADERIPLLLQTPAVVRFVSLEPLLAEIDLSPYLHCGISWCIIGAESGSHARPMDENWVRRLIAQCKQYKIPVFYKQKIVRGKKVSIPMLDGIQYAEFPPIIHKPNVK